MAHLSRFNKLFIVVLILGLIACAENEPFDATPQRASGQTGGTGGNAGEAGQAGSAGASGASGTGGTSGAAGDGGTGGTAGDGGSAGTGGTAGTGGVGGSAGAGGIGGSSGIGGTAGTGGNPNVCTPGASAPCALTATCMGDAICLSDGSGYGICQPRAEVCDNGADDDCDGQIDEDCGSSSGSLGCTAGQAGRTIRARYTMPSGLFAKQLSVFDESDDAYGNPLPRPVACGGTLFDTYYAWGTSMDCGCAEVCYVTSASTIDCIFHRPAGSKIRANVDIWFNQTTDRVWSCATSSNGVIGSVEFWVDGQSVAPGYEIWPQPGKAPACRFILQI